MAESPHLHDLCWLGLANNNIGDAGLDALAASTNLPSLAHLEFRGNPAADPTPQVIIEGSGFVHFIRYPESGKELQARHGHRAWLGDEPKGIPRVEYF